MPQNLLFSIEAKRLVEFLSSLPRSIKKAVIPLHKLYIKIPRSVSFPVYDALDVYISIKDSV